MQSSPLLTKVRVDTAAPALKPKVTSLPPDEGLPELPHLFENEWIWQAYGTRFDPPEETPDNLRLTQLLYRPGARAVASYVGERQWDRWVVEEQFAIELAPDKPANVFRYPDDPYLPGLSHAASALEAHQLLPQYVRLHPHRLHVEAVRYRPATRAVLRHTAHWRRQSGGQVTLFVRVMRPASVDRLLAAADLAERSGFVIPRLAGCWPEGGVVWLARAPGETVRTLIRNGEAPEPHLLLDGLARLWEASAPQGAGRALDVGAAFRWNQRLLTQVLRDEETRERLRSVADSLRPFAESWRPSALAHNDFYDDQLVLTPKGSLALVDFEETGPGDPLLDVGNMLAHLHWMARFGIAPEACAAYRLRFRNAALERFDWDEHELALREAFALFRLSSNPVRHLGRHWPQEVARGLALAAETLHEVA